jgi:hypothetical protein
MKKIYLAVMGVFLFAGANAQEKTTTDTMYMSGKKIIIITEEADGVEKEQKTVSVFAPQRNRVWQGFEIGFTGVSYSKSFSTDVPPGLEYFDPVEENSINWSINPFELDVRLVDEYVKFSTGLGYIAKNFSLENNYFLYKDDADGVTKGTQIASPTLERNRFRTGYITVPAMIYFNTNKDPMKAFRVGFGIVGGVKIFEAYRIKHNEDGHRTRVKYNGGYNAETFMLDYRALVGIGGFNVYATYSSMSLFEDNKGPEVYPFTIGISFINNY